MAAKKWVPDFSATLRILVSNGYGIGDDNPLTHLVGIPGRADAHVPYGVLDTLIEAGCRPDSKCGNNGTVKSSIRRLIAALPTLDGAKTIALMERSMLINSDVDVRRNDNGL